MLAKNLEECVEFAPEGGKVMVRTAPVGKSGGTPGVEFRVALQALEVRFILRKSVWCESSKFGP